MKIFEHKGNLIHYGLYFKNVREDEHPSHQYRHFGFFTSKHLTSIFKTNKNTGNKAKSTTYNFGFEFMLFKIWLSVTTFEEYKYETVKKEPKVRYRKSKVLLDEMYDEVG